MVSDIVGALTMTTSAVYVAMPFCPQIFIAYNLQSVFSVTQSLTTTVHVTRYSLSFFSLQSSRQFDVHKNFGKPSVVVWYTLLPVRIMLRVFLTCHKNTFSNMTTKVLEVGIKNHLWSFINLHLNLFGVRLSVVSAASLLTCVRLS